MIRVSPAQRVELVAHKAAPRDANRRGHDTKEQALMQGQPTGFCGCGCGQRTSIAAYDHPGYGWVKGQPRAFVRGHNGLGSARGPDYESRDCGHDTECWVWLKWLNRKGYGIMQRNRDQSAAHVVFYERHVGPVPGGLELDHLCRNRACVNPAHLEPVTHKENMVRGMIACHVPGVCELRDLRVAARMSQYDLAALVGVSRSSVCNWERGRRRTPLAVLALLRAVLDDDVEAAA